MLQTHADWCRVGWEGSLEVVLYQDLKESKGRVSGYNSTGQQDL